MTTIQIKGSPSPGELAVVLALLARADQSGVARGSVATWREVRRTALAKTRTRTSR
jgi:hypothetical protein